MVVKAWQSNVHRAAKVCGAAFVPIESEEANASCRGTNINVAPFDNAVRAVVQVVGRVLHPVIHAIARAVIARRDEKVAQSQVSRTVPMRIFGRDAIEEG